MDHRWIQRNNRGLLLLIIAGAAVLRLLYINQPFVDIISWRQADDATIADNFFRGHLNIFLPEISWNGPGPNYVGYEFQLTTYLAALLYHLFGQVDWVGRGIAVVSGAWGVFAFYNLVRRAFNEVQALVGCAVLAVMPGGIVVDRSFLPDPVMVSLVITSFWMLLAYLQDGLTRYLCLVVITGVLGILTKISGLIVGVPVVYVILSLLPADELTRLRYLIRLITASALVITPVVGYYAWAVHVSDAYPPYMVAAGNRWVWDAGFDDWLKAGYFGPELAHVAKSLWGIPLLAAALVGLLSPLAQNGRGNLRWLFHCWFLAGSIFYVFGAQEIVENPWNLHIVDPALAGLGAQGLLVAGAALARLRPPLIASAAVMSIILAMHALEMSHLRSLYHPYARESYELGTALARISQPSDLVVTVANAIGDPVVIYYSRRRGWVFPPVWPGADAWEDIADEPAAIRLFDQLRRDGAQWFGIVGEQKTKFRETTPRLLAHIENTTELVDENRDWAIYRISSPPK
jgi:hypothetical protein